jgi:hypothetical protein
VIVAAAMSVMFMLRFVHVALSAIENLTAQV